MKLALHLALYIAIAAIAWQCISFIDQMHAKPLQIESSKDFAAGNDKAEAGIALQVPPGSSVRSIAAELQQRGVLENIRQFVWYARITGQHDDIKAGDYRLEPGLTVPGLMRKLVAGDVVNHRITVVEGLRFSDFWRQIREHKGVKHTLNANSTDAEVMSAIGHPGEHPEGRFLPETYQFPSGTTDVDILLRAYNFMAKVLAEEWQNREENLPYSTPYEALIMASIIEKETGLASERPTIAGVFVRRLQKGMRLQTDPTVIYGMGDRYKGNIRRSDLRELTPYNTYRINGLPPTPIALPGRAAIAAALHPAPGNALYFVSRNDGSHVFSATLREHNNAVNRYQRGQR